MVDSPPFSAVPPPPRPAPRHLVSTTPPDPQPLTRRRDIDGLRAVAIALVLAYHAAPSWVPGGFVGVDVFFVLSGYLITQILVSDQQPGRLRRFYERRLRRLAPALIVVLLTVLALGHLFLLPGELAQLADHTLAATLFVANLAFWSEAGYFDAQAIDKPLLHLWSLGIEEQFYLFWPLVLWTLLRTPRPASAGDSPGPALGPLALARARHATSLLLLASLAACLWMVRSAPDSAFYLPWFRFWELAAGAWLALAPPGFPALGQRGRETLALLALGGLLAAGLTIDPRQPFPAWTALVPVACTAALVWTGDRTALAQRLLATAPMVLLGHLSYPLYLWHWPALSLLHLQAEPDPATLSLTIAACVGLAFVTWALVERPAQRAFVRHPRLLTRVLLLGLAGVAAFAVSSRSHDPEALASARPDLPFYDTLTVGRDQDSETRLALAPRPCVLTSPVPAAPPELCTVTNPGSKTQTIVLWGDSTGVSWGPLVQSWAQEHGARAVVLSVSGCPPLLGIRSPYHPHCSPDDDAWKLAALTELQPSLIVLTGRWGAYLNNPSPEYRGPTHLVTTDLAMEPTLDASRAAFASQLPRTVDRLTEIAPVIVVLAAPDLLRDPYRALVRSLEVRPALAAHRAAQAPFEGLARRLAATRPGVAVLDPADTFCVGETCEAILGQTVLYQDDNHVSAAGAMTLRPSFDRTARELIGREPAP
jgi:peptidoglycan/LPS O-acetylase OafA/YrhL